MKTDTQLLAEVLAQVERGEVPMNLQWVQENNLSLFDVKRLKVLMKGLWPQVQLP